MSRIVIVGAKTHIDEVIEAMYDVKAIHLIDHTVDADEGFNIGAPRPYTSKAATADFLSASACATRASASASAFLISESMSVRLKFNTPRPCGSYLFAILNANVSGRCRDNRFYI